MEKHRVWDGNQLEEIYYAPPFAGLDRNTIVPIELKPDDIEALKRAHKRIPKSALPATNYMARLFTVSSFEYLGIYLTGPPLSGATPEQFIEAQMHVSNGWTKNWPTLRAQGWIPFLLYLGYCTIPGSRTALPDLNKWKEGMPNQRITIDETEAQARGILHAKHIKTIVKSLGGLDGAVVYIDSEGGDATDLIKAYYGSLFDELRTKRADDLPALRPGLYAFDPISLPLVADFQDLFVFRIDYIKRFTADDLKALADFKAREPNNPNAIRSDEPDPIHESGGRIIMEYNLLPIRSVRATNAWRTIIPVGRQGFTHRQGRNEEGIQRTFRVQIPNGPLSNNPDLAPISPWDIGTSFVRDPSFPVGSPRFASRQGILMQGVESRPVGAMAVKPRGADVLDGPAVESDAPLCLSDSAEVYTLGKKPNTILTAGLRLDKTTWSPLIEVPPPATVVALRRIRAFCVSSTRKNETENFTVSTVNRLYVRRRVVTPYVAATPKAPAVPSTVVYSDNILIAPKTTLHPFSSICTASSAGLYTSVFFINAAGLLASAITVSQPQWPGTLEAAIQPGGSPTLLAGTQLAACAPSSSQILVFGVGTDLRLHYASYSQPRTVKGKRFGGWSPPRPLGAAPRVAAPDAEGDAVFAHSRIAARAVSPNKVCAVAISSKGVPALYTLVYAEEKDGSNPRWGMDGSRAMFPRVLPDRGNDGPYPPAQSSADATWWTVNPFGDMELAVEGGGLAIMCAGSTAGEVGVLMRRTVVPGEDWLRVA